MDNTKALEVAQQIERSCFDEGGYDPYKATVLVQTTIDQVTADLKAQLTTAQEHQSKLEHQVFALYKPFEGQGALRNGQTYTADMALAELGKMLAEHQKWLAECYCLTGADPSGGVRGERDEDWRLAPYAVEEVKRLRQENDEQTTKIAERDAHLSAELAKVIYLERMLHNSLHGNPKPTEDCKRFCFITFTKYDDGKYGHTAGGTLNPAEAMMAVYGRSAVEAQARLILEQAIQATRQPTQDKE